MQNKIAQIVPTIILKKTKNYFLSVLKLVPFSMLFVI